MYLIYFKIISYIILYIFNIVSSSNLNTINKISISISEKKINNSVKPEKEKSSSNNKKQNKNCSIFSYVIAKSLKKEPKCKEEDLNIPDENDLLIILKIISDLAEEGKIDLKDALNKEVVHVNRSEVKESVKRLGAALKNMGNSTDHFIIRLMTVFSPIIINLNGGKFDLAPLTKLIRNYSEKLKQQYGKKSNNTVKELIWKENIKFVPEERGIELLKVSQEKIEKFNIKSNGFGPLLKKGKEKLMNIARAIIPPQGFTKLDSFKKYYEKKITKLKGKKLDISLQVQKSIERDQQMDDKMCGMNSLIKAVQINNENILDEKCAKVLLSDYVDVSFNVTDMRQRIKRIFKINKPDDQLSKEEKRKIDNFTAIAEIGISNCKFIREIGLMPLDLMKEYGKVFKLKLYCFNTEEEVTKALKAITRGNQILDKAVVVTPLIFWGNVRNECGMHYLNIIHAYDDGTFLVEDTDGKRYKPIDKYKKNLIKLMRVNIRKSIEPFIKDFNGLIKSGVGEEIRNRILDGIEVFIKDRMGGSKNTKYCFIVADPKGVVDYKQA